MAQQARLLIGFLLVVVVIQSAALATVLLSPSSAPTMKFSYPNQLLNVNALPCKTNLTAPVLFYTVKINEVSNRAINYSVVIVNPSDLPVPYRLDVDVTLISGGTKIYSRWIALNVTLTEPVYVLPLGARSFYTGIINLPSNASSGAYWLIANTGDDLVVDNITVRNRIIAIPTVVIIK